MQVIPGGQGSHERSLSLDVSPFQPSMTRKLGGKKTGKMEAWNRMLRWQLQSLLLAFQDQGQSNNVCVILWKKNSSVETFEEGVTVAKSRSPWILRGPTGL